MGLGDILGDVNDILGDPAGLTDEYASGAIRPLFSIDDLKKNARTKLTDAIRKSNIVDGLDLAKYFAIANSNGISFSMDQLFEFMQKRYDVKETAYNGKIRYYTRSNLSEHSIRTYRNYRDLIPPILVANAIAEDVGELPSAVDVEISRNRMKEYIIFSELEANYGYDVISNTFETPYPGMASNTVLNLLVEREGYREFDIVAWDSESNSETLHYNYHDQIRVGFKTGGTVSYRFFPSRKYKPEEYLPVYQEEFTSPAYGLRGFGAQYRLASDGKLRHWFLCPVAEDKYDRRFTPNYYMELQEEGHIPWIAVRDNKRNTLDALGDTDNPWAKAAKEGLEILGFNLEEMTQSIIDGGSLAEINHAYLAFCCDVASEDPDDLKYLFAVVTRLILKNPKDIEDPKLKAKNSTIYSYEYGMNSSELTLSFKGSIEIRQKSFPDKRVGEVWRVPRSEDNSGAGGLMLYRKESANKISIIKMAEVSQLFRPSGKGPSKERKAVYVVTLKQARASEDRNIILPVDYGIASRVLVQKSRMNLFLRRSVCMTFFSVQVVTTKWYEQESVIKALSDYMTVVSIVTFLATLDPSTFTWSGLISSLAVAGITSYAVQAAIEEWGRDAGIAIIVAAVAVSAYNGSTTVSFDFLPAAVDLINVINLVIKAEQRSVQEEMEELAGEAADFQTDYEKRLEELNALQELMDKDGNINMLYATNPVSIIDANETPSAFIGRALTNNPGTISLRAVHQWHDSLLTLPLPGNVSNVIGRSTNDE